MSDFDPYYKWLGIAPKDQPPHHYRLLGIQVFEDDLDVISSAADQRMAHLRSLQTGKRADLTQRMLNEMSSARVCLLSPEKKAEYDRALRERLGAAALPPKRSPKPLKQPPAGQAAASGAPLAPDLSFISASDRRGARTATRARKKSLLAIMASAAVAAALLLFVVVPLVKGPGEEDDAGSDIAQTKQGVKPREESKKDVLPPLSAKKTAVPAESPPREKPTTGRDSWEPETPPDKGNPGVLSPDQPDTAGPSPDPPRPAAKDADFAEPDDPRRPAPPDDTALKSALASIRDVFKDQYAKPSPKLSKDLIQEAQRERDPTARFALLQEARSVAADLGDGLTAFQAVDETSRQYLVDAPAMKAQVLERLAKRARTAAQHKEIAEQAIKLVDDAIAEESFAAAKQLGKLALSQARWLNDAALAREIAAKGREVDAAATALAAAQASLATLEREPGNAEASAVAGKHYCFQKGDWSKGLPLLAAGSDAALKALAAADIQGAASSEDRMNLGDRWWDFAQTQDTAAKTQIQCRAAYWYEEALLGLSGLVRAKVAKRMETADAQKSQTPGARTRVVAARAPVYLDDLAERDVKLGSGRLGKHGDGPVGGTKVTVAGKVPAHSLCEHPPSYGHSSVSYDLAGRFRTFRAEATVPGERAFATAVTFKVLGDGKLLWESRALKNPGDAEPCTVRLQGVKVLTLQVHCPGIYFNAWATWVEPRLER